MKLMKVAGVGIATLLVFSPSLYAEEKSTSGQERQTKIEQALQGLSAKGEATRNASIQKLGELGAKEHAPKLAEFLKDERPQTRIFAVEALARLGVREYSSDIAGLLPDQVVGGSAARALASFGAKEYAPKISELLKTEDEWTKIPTIEALVELDENVPGLLEHEDVEVRRYALVFLKHLHKKQYAGHFVKRLQDKDAEVRSAAVQVLLYLFYFNPKETEAYSNDIAQFLTHEESDVRLAAAHVLAQLGVRKYAKDSARELAKRLKDKEPEIRLDAAVDLALLQAEGYVKDIARLLRDKDARVRATAVGCLLHLERKEYARDFAVLLKDPAMVRGSLAIWDRFAGAIDPERPVSSFAIRALEEWGIDPAALQEETR